MSPVAQTKGDVQQHQQGQHQSADVHPAEAMQDEIIVARASERVSAVAQRIGVDVSALIERNYGIAGTGSEGTQSTD